MDIRCPNFGLLSLVMICHDIVSICFLFFFSDEINKKNSKIIRLKEINIYKST